MEKNFRASNFSAREENILVNLVKKYKNEIECKKSDTDTNKIKAGAWQKIYSEYNSILGDPHRTVKVLKNKYDNIKKRAKQKFADNKKYVTGTGGGPFTDLVITDTDSDIHEILGTQLTGLSSKYDSDATAESIIIQVQGENNLFNNEDFDDQEEIPPKKSMDIDVSPSTSSRVDIIYSTQDDSHGFSAPAATKKKRITRDQARCLNLEKPEELSPNLHAPLEEESSTNDWATYTPTTLKRPLSVALRKPENKGGTPIKKPTSRQLSAKLEDWAKSKLKYTDVQNTCFIEKHQLTLKHLEEKHQLEMAIQKQESQARMKFLEEEHNLKMKILEKEYAST